LGIALGDGHAFLLVVSQIAGFAVTTLEASQRAMRRVGPAACRRARGSALEIERVYVIALIIIGDFGGDSQTESDGGKTEQQRES
jgi:hypothetical protein